MMSNLSQDCLREDLRYQVKLNTNNAIAYCFVYALKLRRLIPKLIRMPRLVCVIYYFGHRSWYFRQRSRQCLVGIVT